MTTPTEYHNKCRSCGEMFEVDELSIQSARDAYPDEPMSDREAANIVEFCPACSNQ